MFTLTEILLSEDGVSGHLFKLASLIQESVPPDTALSKHA
jgi:hypothetical protein